MAQNMVPHGRFLAQSNVLRPNEPHLHVSQSKSKKLETFPEYQKTKNIILSELLFSINEK